MSVKKSKVEVENYIDNKYSSGDSSKMTMKQLYQEENNNEVDELSKELSEMGCIAAAVKRSPNICVETCVHEDAENSEGEASKTFDHEDMYSDEFEDENSDSELPSNRTDVKSIKSETQRKRSANTTAKFTKSQSSMSTHRPHGSISGRSTGNGPVAIAHTSRVNMSFSNDRLRDIERHNRILLNKILSARNCKTNAIPLRCEKSKKITFVAAASVQRKKQQRKIDHENMILLKKIQGAKSSSYSVWH